MLSQQINTQLATYQQANLLRERKVWEQRKGVQLKLNSHGFCSFLANDYLGLSQHPKVIRAQQQAADWYGLGSGASALVAGYSQLHRDFEVAMANWLGYPRALLCNSGFMANLAAVQSLGQLGAKFLIDAENHASLNDGVRLSKAPFKRYRHLNSKDFSAKLNAYQGKGVVITDGVFSMSGRISDLVELHAYCQKNSSWLMVDDAHGIGVLGAHGKGSLEHHHLSPESFDLLSLPLGKAFAGLGGVLLGQAQTIEYILQTARSYIYTTSLPPVIVAGLLQAMDIIQTESWRRERLCALILHFQTRAQALGLPFLPSQTAIQAILVDDHATVLALSDHLQKAGFLVAAIRPPTVPEGTARLRITLSCLHQKKDIDDLLVKIRQYWEQH